MPATPERGDDLALASGADAALAREWKARGFAYHVSYLAGFRDRIGFDGKDVLEVGGALPPDLLNAIGSPRSWTAVEEPAYYAEVHRSVPAAGLQPEPLAVGPGDGPGYHYRHGAIEDLPAAFEQRFDAIFSIAAFEHLACLPIALDRMFAALRPGGRLFSAFAPVWPSASGSHLPERVSVAGQPVPIAPHLLGPWEHLLRAPSALFAALCERCDRRVAAEVVRLVHHSPHINRLFVEDYVAYFRASPFALDVVRATFPNPATPEMQADLERRHPGRKVFGYDGMLVELRRPA